MTLVTHVWATDTLLANAGLMMWKRVASFEGMVSTPPYNVLVPGPLWQPKVPMHGLVFSMEMPLAASVLICSTQKAEALERCDLVA